MSKEQEHSHEVKSVSIENIFFHIRHYLRRSNEEEEEEEEKLVEAFPLTKRACACSRMLKYVYNTHLRSRVKAI